MTEFKELQAIASEMYNDTNERKWLFSHTATQEEYNQVRRALNIIAHFQPVNWQGKTGDRRAIEI